MSGIPDIGTLAASVSKDGGGLLLRDASQRCCELLGMSEDLRARVQPILLLRPLGRSSRTQVGFTRLRILRCRPGKPEIGARSSGTRTTRDNRPPQEIVISVICITLASARLVYGAEVAERSTMVVGPLPRPSGRFLPRLGPAASARGASFFRVRREKPGEEAAAYHPRKKRAGPRPARRSGDSVGRRRLSRAGWGRPAPFSSRSGFRR